MKKRTKKIALGLTAILILLAAAAGYGYFYYFRSGEIPRVSINKQDFPISGIDISSHNGDINFNEVVDDGIEFVFMKATEGATYKDKLFNKNYTNAKKAGLTIGVYHFFRFNISGKMQALNLLNSIRGKDINLPLVIDVEEWTNDASIPAIKIVERINDMIDYLNSHNYKVIIYTNIKGYYRFYRNRMEKYPLWICSFHNPPLTENHIKPIFWQHSHIGSVAGIPKFVDLDSFYGNRAQWDSYLSTLRECK